MAFVSEEGSMPIRMLHIPPFLIMPAKAWGTRSMAKRRVTWKIGKFVVAGQ